MTNDDKKMLIDLGDPMPNDDHAVSVCFPTWNSIVGYELGDSAIVSRLKMGYPRFFRHPKVVELFNTVIKPDGYTDTLLFLSAEAARECSEYLYCNGQKVFMDMIMINEYKFFGVFFNHEVVAIAKEFWQHTGLGISSRFAEAVLTAKDWKSLVKNDAVVKHVLKKRIASYLESDHVYLFSSGMTAIYQALKLVWKLFPDLKTVQFGFPYVDTLNLQAKFGFGFEFFGIGDQNEMDKLKQLLLQGQRISAVMCEFPSNPLLHCVDLHALRELANRFNFIIIVDDTIGGFLNVHLLKYADIVVSSLTKFFSGTGNVMAGSLVLNPNSSYFKDLYQNTEAMFENSLWCEDAAILELNSRDYEERVLYANKSTEKIVDAIVNHPKVKRIFYPKYNSREIYSKFARHKDSIGYGSLFSLVFHSENDAISFYDNIVISKGPSLGTNFSLICPYTLLAHYNELDYVARYGVDRNLIRFSIGLEDSEYLLQNFKKALDSIS